MKPFIVALALLAGMFLSPSAKAQIKTKEMVKYCQAEVRVNAFGAAKGDMTHFSSDEWTGYGMCVGYFAGFYNASDGLDYDSDGAVSRITVVDGHTIQQTIQAFLDYTTAHPDALDTSITEATVLSAFTAQLITSKEIGVLSPSNQKPSSAPKVVPDGRQTAQNIKSVQK